MNLFCFAYAGGSASIFKKWDKFISGSVQIVPVEIPGRGTRFLEPLCGDMEQLVSMIYQQFIQQMNEKEYSLYGHSMGSWIVHYLLFKIAENGDRMPENVYVSGKEAPHIRKKGVLFHELEDGEFMRKIYRLGGTPLELLENEEFLTIYIPILKNDYKLIETCHYQKPQKRYHMDITVFNGIEDELTTEDIYGWKEYTDGAFQVCNFDGGHFFIHDHAREMLQIIEKQAELKHSMKGAMAWTK
ncbi:MAG: thioesterase [Hungatella sp.]|jgi:surfactin synthase thioesterase subunit|nr:thioesterase [Hungatella sp.]